MRIAKDKKYLYNNQIDEAILNPEVDEEVLDPEEADEGFEKDLEDVLDPIY
ncbi:MAG: hypothetical protein KR126chlam6_00709 [Candidatus Anoxychlamydiales bacterium]|nr:hypothetical protein [Candidatus Anoxychlamydiales bacterium]